MSTNSRLCYALITYIGAIGCFWFVSVAMLDQYHFAQQGRLAEIHPMSTTYTQTSRSKGSTTYEINVANRHQNNEEIKLRQHKLNKVDLNNFAQHISIRRESLSDAPLKTRELSNYAMPRLSVLLIFGFILLIYGGLELRRIKKYTNLIHIG